jgi:arsenate reductase (thioredoxin)
MAERLARKRYQQHEFESAGVMTGSGMHPLTARVLRERGAEQQAFASREVFSLDLSRYDVIVLIGSTAQALFPAPPPQHIRVAYWDIADPYEATGTEDERLLAYRNCADDLELRIGELVQVAMS